MSYVKNISGENSVPNTQSQQNT